MQPVYSKLISLKNVRVHYKVNNIINHLKKGG